MSFFENTWLYAIKLVKGMMYQLYSSSKLTDSRVRTMNKHPINESGKFILYWMTSCRRFAYNASLQHAVSLSNLLKKPILVVEAVSISHKFANDRIVSFMVQGIMDNIIDFSENSVSYIPWVEIKQRVGSKMLASLAEEATCVVIDDYPTYTPSKIRDAAAKNLKIRVDAVDSNGIFPMKWAEKEFTTAYSFRKYVQRNLLDAFQTIPSKNPIEHKYRDIRVNEEIISDLKKNIGFESTPLEWLWRVSEGGDVGNQAMEEFPIDHTVPAVITSKGGVNEARLRLQKFLNYRLNKYSTDRNNPDKPAVSGLSPWLHFGHISSYEIIHNVLSKENWNPDSLNHEDTGKGTRTGWWGVSESSSSFLDQIITWRELGFNFAYNRDDHATVETIPNWAKLSMKEHINDDRIIYSLEELESAETHDEIWNAAQRELLRTGQMHNYMRMLWGKKILEWSPSPEIAAENMIYINDKWALDGRDPNSYTGIFWVLGRHDRAWGPERPIFGKVRYMSSESAYRKLKLKNYLQKYAKDENTTLAKFG